MKFLKQLIIFLFLTGAIFGIFTLVNKQEPTFDKSVLAGNSVESMRNKIDKEWEKLQNFDLKTYEHQLTSVAQSYSTGIIDENGRATLNDRVNKNAFTKAVQAMNREFALSNCDENTLKTNYEGLMTIISRENGFAEIPEIDDVLQTYSLYNEAKAFINRGFGLSPSFSFNTLSWTPSWPNYNHRKLNEYVKIISNLRWHKIRGISAMQKINETHSKLADAKTRYYNNLYSQITSAFTEERDKLTNEASALNTKPDLSGLLRNLQTLRVALLSEDSTNPINSQLHVYSKNFQ